VRDALYEATTKGIVTNSRTANNHLLFTLFDDGGSEPVNQPPIAAFTYSCTGLECQFTDTSTDADGTIVSRSWDFGDAGSSDTNPSHTYAAAGTYTVTLTVTDDDEARGTTSEDVTVSEGASSGPTLSGSAAKSGPNWIATVTLIGSVGDKTSGTWTPSSGNEELSCAIQEGASCAVSMTSHNRVGQVTYTDLELGSVTIYKP
jgi:PKD repeat protein